MNKHLLKNEADFDSLIAFFKALCGGYVNTWKPEQYPAVAVHHIIRNDNGPDDVDYDFVYLTDFES